MVAQEILHNMNKMKGKNGFVVVKLDLAKACSNLGWIFIQHVLHEIGFPQKFVSVILFAVSFVNMNIKWNGKKITYFQPKRA